MHTSLTVNVVARVINHNSKRVVLQEVLKSINIRAYNMSMHTHTVKCKD